MSLAPTWATADDCAAEIALRTAALPTILWIELTSRCPFDCIFCSRKLLRGKGQHMDFALYERLIGELQQPEIIRLNYSGESVHYPKLVEAIALAAQTGAQVELVTALAALPNSKIEALARAGLSQLTVSLHSLNPAQFEEIYRFNQLEALRERLQALVRLRDQAPRPLRIDLAFVAMQRNLDQLPAIVDYALQLGLPKVAVHPVIRRDPIEEHFNDELDDGRLRPAFAARIEALVSELRGQNPQLAIELSTPEVAGQCADPAALDGNPRYYPGPLPAGARIAGCDQDPWQTVHILADGRVVSCEERDQLPLGDLRQQSLSEIWHGEAYQAFRRAHLLGSDARCRQCPYKIAHLPQPPPRRVLPGREGMAALLTGWHPEAGAELVWSKPRALLQVSAAAGEEIRLRLLLPAAPGGNQVRIGIDGQIQCEGENADQSTRELSLRLRAVRDGVTRVELQVRHGYRPGEREGSADQRELGIGLLALEVGRRGWFG